MHVCVMFLYMYVCGMCVIHVCVHVCIHVYVCDVCIHVCVCV